MKIAHTADLHFCAKHLKWVERAFHNFCDRAIAEQCDVAVIAGDSFDSSMPIHEPAVSSYLNMILWLAGHMPVLILQGTYSHDRPGSLDIFKGLPTRGPIHVADTACQVSLCQDDHGKWVWSAEPKNILFSVLPSVNKADPKIRELGAREYISQLFEPWAKENEKARAAGIPTVLVTHGTVSGCRTESGYAMVSPDWEFEEQLLYSCKADVVMLGHIHAHQHWSTGFQHIAYPGSLARLVHGDHADKGFLIWELEQHQTGSFEPTFHVSPTRTLIEIEFDGPPDMDELSKLAEQAGPDADVRIRWDIDQEHAHTIDKAAIRKLFEGADSIKLEGTINTVQSVRAAGISSALTLEEKLGYYASTTGDEDKLDGMTARLQLLQTKNVDEIVSGILDNG